MIDPVGPVEDAGEPLVTMALPSQEKDLINHLIGRYDELLSQAEVLNEQIENLLREWNPESGATRGSSGAQSPPS